MVRGQVTLPRAGHPADDLPHKAGNPADPLDPPVHHTTPSYSAVAQIFPDSLAKPSDQPGSPGGWGAVDPTRAEESDSEEHVSPLPPYPLHSGSPPPEQQATLIRQQYVADLSSFCFSSPPLQHPPPLSSSRRPSPRLQPRESLSEIRKPVKYLKCLLSQNIERAVMNKRGGRGGWLWEVSVKRDFEENMVWDSTSFHGVSFSEEYEEYEPLGHFRLENDL